MSDDEIEQEIADEAGEVEEPPVDWLQVGPPEGVDADGDGHPGEGRR